jgi:hypothetical protein
MKVEIELHDLEQIKADLNSANHKVQELRDQLSKYSDKTYMSEIKYNAHKLFIQFNKIMLEKIGFENPNVKIDIHDIMHWAKGEYKDKVLTINEEKIKADLIVTYTQEFKRVFLNMDIDITKFKQ